MEYSQVRALVVLLLVVAALGAAGATIDGGGDAGGGSPGVGDGAGAGIGEGDDGGIIPEPSGMEDLGGSEWFGPLVGLVYATAFVGLLALAAWFALRRQWRRLALTLAMMAIVLVVAIAAGIGLVLLFRAFADLIGLSGSTGGLGGDGGVGLGGSDEEGGVDLPLGTVAILLLVAVAAAVLVGYLGRSDAADEETPSDAPAGNTIEPDVVSGSGPVPSHHVREDVPADNDVYRAWLALADAADAPATRESPATVERRAIDAGIDETVVGELRTVFEDVRYGGAPVTEERARRAVEAIERVDSSRGRDLSGGGTR